MDLSRAGLVTTRHIADLDMADVRPGGTQPVGDGAFLHLDVEGVEAQLDVLAAQCLHDRHAFVDAVVQEVGKARAAARLEDQREPGRAGCVRRPADVLQEEVHALARSNCGPIFPGITWISGPPTCPA